MATYSRKRSVPVDFDSSPPIPRRALGICSANVIKTRASSISVSTKTKKPRLTQLTIDLGGDPHKKCKLCGMEYMQANPEDAALHKQYHNTIMDGMEVPKSVSDKAKIVYECQKKIPKPGAGVKSKLVKYGKDKILQICRRDALCLRRLAQKALQVVERELGAVEISEDALWSQIPGSLVKPEMTANLSGTVNFGSRITVQQNNKFNRYKVFLYIQDGKCIGLCLVERISEARSVLPHVSLANSSSISANTKAIPARLGISRIWVSRDARGLGIAKTLIDISVSNFSNAATPGKDMVAWSQPTESGAKLARAWFGTEHGWLVYDEQHIALQKNRVEKAEVENEQAVVV